MRTVRSWRGSAAAALALVLAACGGGDKSTGPGASVVIDAAPMAAPAVSENAQGPTITCTASLTARLSGEGTATWLAGKVRLYIGADRKHPVDSATIQQSEVASAWGKATIASGETQTSKWTIWAQIPFSADVVFNYQVSGGGSGSVPVRMDCTLPIPANTPPPTITNPTVTPPSGKLPAGAPLTIAYSASAAAGLWQTQVHVTGPCDVRQVFNERLQTTTSRTISLKLPADCRLDVPLTVTVTAVDAAVQVAERSLPLSLVIADTEPPTLTPLFFPLPFGSAQPVPSGDYFVGDSVPVLVNAVDNHALAAIVWEVLPLGQKDSLRVTGAFFTSTLKIPVRPDWPASPQLKLYARDALGLTSAATVTPVDSIRVHPAVDRKVRTGTVPGQGRAFAIDAPRGVIYVAEGNQRRLSVFSMTTMQVVKTLALPTVPTDLDMTPGGDSLLIAMFGTSLGVVDLRAPTLSLSTLPLSLDPALGQVASRVRALANGHAMVGINATVLAGWTLVDVALATGAQRTRSDIAVNGIVGSVQIERSLDGTVLAVSQVDPACLRRYTVSTDAFTPCTTPKVRDWQPALDSTGRRLAIGSDVYDPSMTLLPKLGPNLTPGGIAYGTLSADGQSLFQIFIGRVVRLRADDLRILDRTTIPSNWVNAMPHVSKDGKTLVLMATTDVLTTLMVMDAH